MRPRVSRDGDPHYPSGSQPAESGCPLLPSSGFSLPCIPGAGQATIRQTVASLRVKSTPKVALKTESLLLLHGKPVQCAYILLPKKIDGRLMFHVLNGIDSMLVIVGISGYADQTIVDESDDEGLGGSVLGFGCIVPHSSTGRQS